MSSITAFCLALKPNLLNTTFFVLTIQSQCVVNCRLYDSILAKYNLTKVDQTNDQYSAVSGVPERVPTHASEVALFVLELMTRMKSFVPREGVTGGKIQLRAGVHSGMRALV